MESHSDITIFLAPCFFCVFVLHFTFLLRFCFYEALLSYTCFDMSICVRKSRPDQSRKKMKRRHIPWLPLFCLLELCKNAEFLFATFLYGRFCLFFNHFSECGQLTCCISVEDQRQSIHFVPFDGKRRTRTR